MEKSASKRNLTVNLYIIKKYLKINIKEGSQWIYALVILIDSVYRKDKNCSPQVFLEKYDYFIIEHKMSNFNDDIRNLFL